MPDSSIPDDDVFLAQATLSASLRDRGCGLACGPVLGLSVGSES